MPAYAPSLPPERLDTLRRVELAEGVEIALPTAGPFVRVVAYGIDCAVIAAGWIVLCVAVPLVGMMIPGVATGLLLVLLFLWTWGYFLFFEARHRGATPGKRLRGLRVVQTSGEPITLAQAMVRSISLFLEGYMTLGLLGLVAMTLSRRFQRLGDLAAGTVVVYDEKAIQPPLLAAPRHGQATPSPLPVRLTREERQALLSYAERAPAWSEARQAELAGLVPRLSGGADHRASRRLQRHAAWLREN